MRPFLVGGGPHFLCVENAWPGVGQPGQQAQSGEGEGEKRPRRRYRRYRGKPKGEGGAPAAPNSE